MGYILGKSWKLLSERDDSFNESKVRDPFPLVAEKAGSLKGPTLGRILRVVCIICMTVTMYGTVVVEIELIGGILFNLSSQEFPYW